MLLLLRRQPQRIEQVLVIFKRFAFQGTRQKALWLPLFSHPNIGVVGLILLCRIRIQVEIHWFAGLSFALFGQSSSDQIDIDRRRLAQKIMKFLTRL